MKNSKRIQRLLNKIDELEEHFRFYSNGNEFYDILFSEIKSTIDELAMERKVDHARFAKKLKGLWKNQEED